MTVNVGELAPDCAIVLKGQATTVHAARRGSAMVLVFLRHLR
jgi:hypothetical protein